LPQSTIADERAKLPATPNQAHMAFDWVINTRARAPLPPCFLAIGAKLLQATGNLFRKYFYVGLDFAVRDPCRRIDNVPPALFAKLSDPAKQWNESLKLPWGSAAHPVAPTEPDRLK
jgi:hypothetical protein